MKKISLIALALCCSVLFAQTASELYQKLNAKYGKLSTFQASIQQTNYYPQLKKSIVYSGNIWFTPGKMVMRFDKPSLQRLQITNGKVELYDKNSNTLYRSDMLPEFGKMNPVEILQQYWGKSKVSLQGTVKGIATVQLIPKNDPMIKTLNAKIDTKTGIVNQLSYTDSSGNTVTYVFSNIKTNQNIPPAVWKFSYPKNVQVIS